MEKASLGELVADLESEQAALDAVLGALTDAEWRAPSPAAGWTVAHEVAHLTYFDRTAAESIRDPGAFVAERDRMLARVMAGEDTVDGITLGPLLPLGPRDLLGRWREGRARLSAAAASLGEDDRVEWYGPSMSARSFLTARLMEVWAHGLDIVDAVGARREPTDRLRHIAQLGVITRGWSYRVRGASEPDAQVRVNLSAPSGATWSWGPDDAVDSISGPAWDFCAVVTQRRHVEDTSLEVVGATARDWMLVAQAFAGGPTEGPPPRAA